MKKLLNMDKKKLTIIIVIVLILIILVLCLRFYIDNKNFREMVENKNYTSMNDFESVREVLVYMNCEYIKEENNDIYLKFAKDLYEEGESSEGFYTNLACYIANVLKYENYNLIDKERNIYINVECDKKSQKVTKMTINGDSSYFANMNSKNSLSNFKRIDDVELEIKSDILKKCIEENWRTSKVQFGTKESKFDNYDIYFDEGLEVRNVGTKVFNVVFTDKYKDEIVNSIKVGMKLDEIKEILGTPTFEEDYVIGYKTKDIYIFFSEAQVSVYRVENFEDDGFTEFLNEQKDETDINKILNALTDLWTDYDERTEGQDSISITYSLRGIKFEYGLSDKNGIIIYSNYFGNIVDGKNLNNVKAEDLQNGIYVDTEENLVLTAEKNRNIQESNYSYICSMTMKNDEETKLSGLSNKFYYGCSTNQNGSKSMFFYSIDNEYPKYEFEGNITSYMWLDDYRLLYSINNRGIYILDLTNRNKEIVKEGQGEFVFKSYKNNILSYDEDETIEVK